MANGVRKSSLVRQIGRREQKFSASAVQTAVGRSPAKRLSAVCLDRWYYGLPDDLWPRVLQYTGVDQGQYVPERYDCDDFAVAFKAAVSRKLHVNGAGIVVDLSGRHAYNALLTFEPDGPLRVSFLEPQTDRLVIQPSGQYPMRAGYILF